MTFHCNSFSVTSEFRDCFDEVGSYSLSAARTIISQQKSYKYVNLEKNVSAQFQEILRYKFYSPSIALLDVSCTNATIVLEQASKLKYFNKTYQWLIIDENLNSNVLETLNSTMEIGLNSQILYINKTESNSYELYDVYSKGRHIGSPMNISFFAKWSYKKRLEKANELQEMREIIHRGQFNLLTLRGVIVIDKDNITTNEQVFKLLQAEDYKSVGLFSMIKYASELVKVISDRLNFTIDYRVTRGWAGRLQNTSYRLGLMGVVQRGEVDIAASPSFLRISRIKDLDFYHQSWIFEAGFIYVYSNLVKHKSGGGDFLAPFNHNVWIFSLISFIFIIAKGNQMVITDSVLLQSVAVICQQGLDPAPKKPAIRIVVFSLILFSLLMYNYYTSSVVGGLISNNDPGIKDLEELAKSRLTLIFEDIGYNKVVMTEPTNRSIVMKIRKKFFSQSYTSYELDGYTTLSKAISYIRAGTHAYHCEFIPHYDEIAKIFDPNEICNLRTITGLLKHETLAMVLTKKSQYLEMFKIILTRAREVGIVKRELKRIQNSRPKCQGALTVSPVAMASVLNAFIILMGKSDIFKMEVSHFEKFLILFSWCYNFIDYCWTRNFLG
ncbi:ionotropic receptor 75a [Condylostylus longicornis]|uniref:ionotropic receptor 75a n=1 Tax=Condylostylus longicornis TaxID=2530218 RepID=UPI00244E529E|nr:ionotropic receptor 75a [Condylostylus longicornis]